jgi:hypothetical protein
MCYNYWSINCLVQNQAIRWQKVNSLNMVANIVMQEWLAWYLWPSLVTLDHRSEFIGQDFHDMCKNSCRIKIKVISTCNPQVNAIIKCAHQMLGNLLMSFQLQEKHLYDLDYPWVGILAAVAFCPLFDISHYPKSNVLTVHHLTNWTAIKKCEQQLICKNNQIKNSKWVP